MTTSKANANDPNVEATDISLPTAPRNRNSEEPIWLTEDISRNCLRNLNLY